MGVLTITRTFSKGGKKQEIVAPVLYIKYLGLSPREMGVLSLQGSLRKGERSKRWLHLYIKDLGLNSWKMGVLTITRIPPKEGKKQEIVASSY